MGARTLVLESPFLVTLVPSSCFWDATVWVSYEVGLGELAFLWLLVNLSETWTVGTDKPVVIVFLVFCPEGSSNSPVSVGPEFELVTYKVEDLLGSSSDFSKFTSQPNSWHIFTRSCVCWRQAGGMWLSPTSHLGTGGFLYPSVWPSVSTPLLLQWTPWVQWTDRKTVLWTGMSDPGHEISDISKTVPVLIYGSRRLWGNPFPLLEGGPGGLRKVWFAQT